MRILNSSELLGDHGRFLSSDLSQSRQYHEVSHMLHFMHLSDALHLGNRGQNTGPFDTESGEGRQNTGVGRNGLRIPCFGHEKTQIFPLRFPGLTCSSDRSPSSFVPWKVDFASMRRLMRFNVKYGI